jgi:V/A-type H+-transporting ATPase subunit A
VDWLSSYSLYADRLSGWYNENVNTDWSMLRGAMLSLLQEEARLDEIVRLVGIDALSPDDRLTMETAKSVREDYLNQNAFSETDTYASLNKQFLMMKLILEFNRRAAEALSKKADIEDILKLDVKEQIGRAKYIPENEIEKFDAIFAQIKTQMHGLTHEEDENA